MGKSQGFGASFKPEFESGSETLESVAYQIQFSPQAQRQFRKLTQDLQNRITPHIESLGGNPRPAGCVKLHAEDDLWRIRIGDYCVVCQIRDKVSLVIVLVVRHRREVYR